MRAAVAAALLLASCASVRDSKTYIVNVATYWQPRQASIIREDLAHHGYDAYIEQTMVTLRSARPIQMIVTAEAGETYPTNVRYVVRVGPFDNAADAGRARDELRAAGFRAYIVHH